MRAVFVLPFLVCPAFAQEDQGLCEMTDDQANCNRIIACIGTEGRWFHGRAFGRGEGTLSGVISDGVACKGDWVSRNRFGFGQADVSCSDGMTVTVIYYYQDEYTGTALGKGLSSTGEAVESWSGGHVLSYFRKDGPTDDASLRCGSHDILLS